MQALLNFLAGLRNTAKDAFKVELSGRKLALPIVADLGTILNVAADGIHIVIIKPPAGELWRIKAITAIVPAVPSSTTGTHYISFRSGITISNGSILTATSQYNSEIRISHNYIVTANASSAPKYPTTEGAQQLAILNIVASNDNPLYICYYNGTDKTQSGTLTLRVLKEVEYIV